MTTPPNPREALRADLQRSVEFSWNFANAKPDIGENEKMHVLGLCRMLNLAIEALAAQPPAVSVDDATCEAIYDAVSRANLTRDVKSPERKCAVVRAALNISEAGDAD